ncbi:hypothetical protein B0H14DRAFT_3442767 [Mycena olivaceomarginata]|nr:hypothetical protein B0H14DRAFT_3442767 [Mycena olivaceomarginata]
MEIWPQNPASITFFHNDSSDPDSSDSDNCHWDGTEVDKVPQLFETFNHHNIVYDGSDTEWRCEDGPLPSDDQSDESDQDLEGLELLRSFALAGNDDEASIATAYQAITEYKSEKNWKEAEKKLKGPYTGNSERSQQRNDKKLRDKEEEDKISRMSAGRHFFQKHAATARANILASALTEIDKLIASKKDVFHAGSSSLQSYRVRAIQSHLHMVVRNRKGWKPASETAAEAQGFATQWGGRMVRKWTRSWISDRVIPESQRGKHGKSYSLYDDPVIRAELRSRWSPAAADKYLRKITEEEMPIGLKKYMEVELFPRISFKVGRGVSLRTARRLLQREGFIYTEHKKSLYYDGHERPDVVDDRQNRFLPAMAQHRHRLVEYKVGDVDVELDKVYDGKYVLRRLVLAPHDEMTAQCNDGPTKSWVLEGEQPLRKKGVGRGLHRSDVICSTVGYILDAGEELEYGKSYEGYWDGTKFMVQLKNKIIPAFEATHGPGYQMLLMVDHSQGHCMYRLDALLVSRMNLNPGGK